MQKQFKKLTVQASISSNARIMSLHSYYMLHNQNFNLSLDLDDDFRELQLKNYLKGDLTKLDDIENPILTIEGPVKGPIPLYKRIFCCLCINHYSPPKDQDATVNKITKEDLINATVGYPNLGPVRTNHRHSFYAKCYKCSESDWTLVYPQRSHLLDEVWKWTSLLLLAISSFSNSMPGVAALFSPLVFLIPCLYATAHHCRNCNAFIAKLH